MNDLELEDNIQRAERVVGEKLSGHRHEGRQSKDASQERPMDPLPEHAHRREPSNQHASHPGGHDPNKHRRRPSKSVYKEDNLDEEESGIYQPTYAVRYYISLD